MTKYEGIEWCPHCEYENKEDAETALKLQQGLSNYYKDNVVFKIGEFTM